MFLLPLPKSIQANNIVDLIMKRKLEKPHLNILSQNKIIEVWFYWILRLFYLQWFDLKLMMCFMHGCIFIIFFVNKKYCINKTSRIHIAHTEFQVQPYTFLQRKSSFHTQIMLGRITKGITHLLNVTHVIIWDTLLDIVLLTKIILRRRTGNNMPMQLKKMNQTRIGSHRMKTLVKSMS